MSDLALVYEALATWLGSFITTMRGSWFTQIILFIPVLAGIVSVLQYWRGGK